MRFCGKCFEWVGKMIKDWFDKKIRARKTGLIHDIWCYANVNDVCTEKTKEGRKDFLPDDFVVKWSLMSNVPHNHLWYKRMFTKFHIDLKAKFIGPIVLIAEKIMGNSMPKTVMEAPFNRNILLFNDAYEKTIEDWIWLYARNPAKRRSHNVRWYKKFIEGYSVRILNTIKRLIISTYINDTAYREFANILMYNLTLGMNGCYGKVGKIDHVFFTGHTLDDVNYLKIAGTNNEKIVGECPGGFLVVNKGDAVILKTLPDDLKEKLRRNIKNGG